MSLRSNKKELNLLLGYAVYVEFRFGAKDNDKQWNENYGYRKVILWMNFSRILLLAGFTGVISSILLWTTIRLYSVPLTLLSMACMAVFAFKTNPYTKKYPFELYQRIKDLQINLPEHIKLQVIQKTSAFIIFQVVFFIVFELPLALFGVKLLMAV